MRPLAWLRKLRRVRTSTWILTAVFLVTLAAYALVQAGHARDRRQHHHHHPADGAVLGDARADPDHLARHHDAARPEGHANEVAVPVRLAQTERPADGVPSPTADPAPSAAGSPLP